MTVWPSSILVLRKMKWVKKKQEYCVVLGDWTATAKVIKKTGQYLVGII